MSPFNQDICKTNASCSDLGALEVKNLLLKRGEKIIFNSFSLDFACCGITAILGPSGCGKTSLLDCVAGLLTPQDGLIRFNGSASVPVSYLFQDPRLIPWCTLLQNIMLPLQNLMHKTEAQDRACNFLEHTGLILRKDDLPVNLSGGERQRAALARAFAFPAPILLMDEAFQSQDMVLKKQLMILLRNLLEKEPRTVIMVSHDVREALFLADRILVFSESPVRVTFDETVHADTSDRHISLEKRVMCALTASSSRS